MVNELSESPNDATALPVSFVQREVICQECNTHYQIIIPSDAWGQDSSMCPNPSCAKVLDLDYDSDLILLLGREQVPGF